MKTTISMIINNLRADHRNMAMLLSLLDAETSRPIESSEPDFAVLRLIMTYMSEYPDAVHHPREDLIYRHLKSHYGELDESLARIESDHENLEQAAVKISNDLDNISATDKEGRQALMDELRDYSQNLRKHIFWEEKEFFELADKLDDEEGWAEILARSEAKSDPLFGNTVERHYKKLFDRIQRFIIWDNQQYFI